jgi:hypothetical protein
MKRGKRIVTHNGLTTNLLHYLFYKLLDAEGKYGQLYIHVYGELHSILFVRYGYSHPHHKRL